MGATISDILREAGKSMRRVTSNGVIIVMLAALGCLMYSVQGLLRALLEVAKKAGQAVISIFP